MPERTRTRTTAGRRVRGQALVLFLTLIGVLCLGVILLFDTSQVVNKKVKLTNTADAAAYSVAVQQAKAYNLAAYLNRAQVGNEVAIAQIVSLWSWMNMLHTHTLLAYNLFTYLSMIPAPGLNMIARALAEAYKIAEKIVAAARTGFHTAVTGGGMIPGFQGGLVSALSYLNTVYSHVSTAVLDYVGLADGYNIVQDVIERNDPTAQMSAAAHILLMDRLRMASGHEVGPLSAMLERHERPGNGGRDAGMDRFRNVIMGSRDRFSADRGQRVNLLIIDAGTSGGTDMIDYERWAGLDTMDIRIRLPWPFRDIRAPLGWGGAQALKDSGSYPDFFPGIESASNGGPGWYSHEHGRNYSQYGGASGSTAQTANRYPSVDSPALWGASNNLTRRRDAYFPDYQGLQAYHDVKAEIARSPEGKDAGPVFTVYLHSERATARTSQDIDGLGSQDENGPLHLKGEMDGNNRITAVSSAQTYFHRPRDREGLFHRMVPRSWNGRPQADEQLEMGSLFSPYWQARLIETPLEDYALVGIDHVMGGT